MRARCGFLGRAPHRFRAIYNASRLTSYHPASGRAERLTADGLVMTKRKRLELTRAGKLAAPSTAPQLASHGQYVPPRVVRRAGTEIHRTLPSVRGGQRYWREA